MTIDEAVADVNRQLDAEFSRIVFENGAEMVAHDVHPSAFDEIVDAQRSRLETERPRILARCRHGIVTTLEERNGASPRTATVLADADALIAEAWADVMTTVDRLCAEAGATPTDRATLDAFARREMAAARKRLLDGLRTQLTGVAA